MTSAFIFLITPLLIGLFAFLFRKRTTPSTTLLFHSLYKETRLPHSLSEISVKKFSAICNLICSERFKSIHFSNKGPDNQDSLAIIFDDGLKSNMIAADILEQSHLTATFFICSGTISGDSITDVYSNKEYLSVDDIKSLADRGFEIGSHSVTHLDLTLLSTDDLRIELSQSKEDLERVINKPVTSLSFPYGIWNNHVVDIAKEVGYQKFAVYNFEAKENQIDIFHSTGIYPFDSLQDIKNKIRGVGGFGLLRAAIIPHFAKGTPLAVFSPLYQKIPTPWFTNSKKKK